MLFRADTEVEFVEDGRVVQGFLEQSNVNPVAELARMIEVQRAYEYGQKLLDPRTSASARSSTPSASRPEAAVPRSSQTCAP